MQMGKSPVGGFFSPLRRREEMGVERRVMTRAGAQAHFSLCHDEGFDACTPGDGRPRVLGLGQVRPVADGGDQHSVGPQEHRDTRRSRRHPHGVHTGSRKGFVQSNLFSNQIIVYILQYKIIYLGKVIKKKKK